MGAGAGAGARASPQDLSGEPSPPAPSRTRARAPPSSGAGPGGAGRGGAGREGAVQERGKRKHLRPGASGKRACALGGARGLCPLTPSGGLLRCERLGVCNNFNSEDQPAIPTCTIESDHPPFSRGSIATLPDSKPAHCKR
ncbi:hypothetical protein J0S82_011613 [Galemys pyrenaicus]|uniref:Uncharacterized protein n=1 Tax=Galemys pyrenaicus TaxID=202257 RepID=A0A8J6A968_GALPY|nr:hypothetical protein J0S82_011613 [Galemys pyrenaicus]